MSPSRYGGAVAAELPAEDRVLSPFTGWTRAHWELLADGLLAGVRRFASPRHAFLYVPGGRPSSHGRAFDGLEGFARTFLLAAYRLRGAGGAAPGDLAGRYATGLAAGTRGSGPEAWPRHADRSQSLVEAALIALALFDSRPWVWEALDDAERERAAAWLSSALDKRTYHNNWLLFPLLVAEFLRSVGVHVPQARSEELLEDVERLHLGGGWYSDGGRSNFDHYCGWGFAFDSLLWCRMGADRHEPERARTFRDRARAFLGDYRYLVAASGAPLHHGRSLVYRFAAASPFLAGALLDSTPLPPGETRRLASGMLRHFVDRALPHNMLPLGWYGEFLPMVQRYSCSASPYLAAKAFVGLVLPPEHPVWTAREEPVAVERGDFCRALTAPGFLVLGTQADGIVRVASHLSDHRAGAPGAGDPHYRKLVYSTHSAPEIGPLGEDDVDATVAFRSCLLPTRSRTSFDTVAVEDHFAVSCARLASRSRSVLRRLPGAGLKVETASIGRPPFELRVHALRAVLGTLRDGGFAVADVGEPAAEIGPNWALVRRPDGLTSFSAGLHGYRKVGVRRREGDNAYGPRSAAPYLLGRCRGRTVLVSLHCLTAAPFDPDHALALIEGLDVRGDRVQLRLVDGSAILLQLGEPEPVRLELAGEPLHGRIRLARVSPGEQPFVVLSDER